MDIDYIKEFVVLAEIGNYLEAAEQLYLTQSSLTRHIQKMELDLGVQLFDRTTRKVSLNHYGKLFLPYAKQIVDLQDGYISAFTKELQQLSTTLRIGSIPVMAQYQITDLITHFRHLHNDVLLDIVEADTLQSYKMLYNNELDFAITRDFDDENTDFTRIPITSDTVVALIPQNHPLAKSNTIELKQLYRDPLLLLGKDTFMYSLCVKECNAAGFEPHVAFTSHRVDNIIDLISKGMGIGLFTKRPVLAAEHSKIVVTDVVPPIKTTINLTYFKNNKLSPAATDFVRFFHEQNQ